MFREFPTGILEVISGGCFLEEFLRQMVEEIFREIWIRDIFKMRRATEGIIGRINNGITDSFSAILRGSN